MAPARTRVDRMASPGCSPGPFQMEGTLPPSSSLPSRHQTTAGTDSSLEEILRQAGCKQQPGEGVEHVEGSSAEAGEASRGEGDWGGGEAAGKGTSKVGT